MIDAASDLRHHLRVDMLDAVGLLEPVLDAADGMRRDMEARGWSSTMAEHCAGSWLAGTLLTIARGGA